MDTLGGIEVIERLITTGAKNRMVADLTKRGFKRTGAYTERAFHWVNYDREGASPERYQFTRKRFALGGKRRMVRWDVDKVALRR
jgi:hypothetical protein